MASVVTGRPQPDPGVEQWAAELWSPDSPLHRSAVRMARWECPECGRPLAPGPTPHGRRRCKACRLDWYWQWSELDGSPKPGSYTFAFRAEA